MYFQKLDQTDKEKIKEMSDMATSIVKDFFDDLIGPEQNDYMISLFQTVDAITNQLSSGYRYYFVKEGDENIGFVAFYKRGDHMYLSKFYLYEEMRGRGYAHQMMDFVIEAAKADSLSAIELNVNRGNSACKVYESLGFYIAREEKNDIGNGFFMDDYVYRKDF